MKRVGTWLALAALTVCSASAATRIRPEVQADVVAWRKHPLVQQHYREPPKGWHVTKNHGTRLTFATPCKPDMQNRAAEETLLTSYLCSADGMRFIVNLAPADYLSESDVIPEYALAAAYMGWRRGLKNRPDRKDAEVRFAGELRIAYAGVPARQLTQFYLNRESPTRLLIGPRVFVVMQMAGDAGTVSADADRFFSSLKFQ